MFNMLRGGHRALTRTTRCSILSQHRSSTSVNAKTQIDSSPKSSHEVIIERNAEKAAKEQLPTTRTQSQIDEDMRKVLEGLAGDGGDAGIELEDGKPAAMKRGVRENMFRYI